MAEVAIAPPGLENLWGLSQRLRAGLMNAVALGDSDSYAAASLEAKAPLVMQVKKKQVLRFAQDDNH